MNLSSVCNLIALYGSYAAKKHPGNAADYLDSAVRECILELVESQRYLDDADDSRLLHDVKVALLISPTLAVAEVDKAIKRWRKLNHTLLAE